MTTRIAPWEPSAEPNLLYRLYISRPIAVASASTLLPVLLTHDFLQKATSVTDAG